MNILLTLLANILTLLLLSIVGVLPVYLATGNWQESLVSMALLTVFLEVFNADIIFISSNNPTHGDNITTNDDADQEITTPEEPPL